MTSAAKKTAQTARRSAQKTARGAVEAGRSSAENVVDIGGAMQEFMATSAGETQRVQEKAFALGRENAENLARSADAATKWMYELVGMSRDNIETCMECGDITASLIKDASGEIFEGANRAFSDNMELAKEFFACRTINDMIELQNRAVRSAIDNFFNRSARLSNLLFEYTSETLEPINERVNTAAEQLSKATAA